MSAQVTGVGSLSHKDAAEAVAFVAEVCPELPFCPDLPTLPGESMQEQTDRFLGADQAPGAGLVAFEAALAAGAFPRALGLKSQRIGPITVAACLTGRDLISAPLLPIPRVSELSGEIARSVAAHLERWSTYGLPVQVWIDEPCLGTVSAEAAEAALGPVFKAIRDAGARAGLHCCAADLPLDLVAALAPDVFSFDAWSHLEAFCADPAAARIVAQTQIAWGLVPTLEAPPLVDVLAARWRSATAALGVSDLAERSLFTASCGLANHTPEAARASFALAEDLAIRT